MCHCARLVAEDGTLTRDPRLSGYMMYPNEGFGDRRLAVVEGDAN